jgi:signal transduction histidine kinase
MSFAAGPGIQAAISSQSETNALLEIHSLTVDGLLVPLHSGEKLRLTRPPRTAVFQFGPSTNRVHDPTRFRFRLDGYGENWREYPAEMRLTLRFLDDRGDQVSETAFKVQGQSEGWTGNLETAEFIRRRETVPVPPRARSVAVAMSSAGPAATVGVYAISGLTITSQLATNAPPVISLSKALDAGIDTAGGDAPAGWMRDGLRRSMAKLFERASPSQTRGIVIVDDDVKGHAEWHMIKSRAVAVDAGDNLLLEWDEAYSFGLSGPVSMQYLNVPAGYYRFRLEELSLWGEPNDREISLAFEVPMAFWRTPWFWVSMATIALAAALGAWRYTVVRRVQLQLQGLQQQRAVDRERLRIAQDIHDDLGARVTQISLLSAVAQSKPSLPDDARADFSTISQTTRELVSALYETVWAVNPENDNLDSLASYLCQMGNQLCSQSQLRCRFEMLDMLPSIPLNSQVRHNLIMAVKEAIHNVIKHARATEVRIRIAFENSELVICIHDDGCGFDIGIRSPGYGLGNLKRRMGDIGGSFTIESHPGGGTHVCLRLSVVTDL